MNDVKRKASKVKGNKSNAHLMRVIIFNINIVNSGLRLLDHHQRHLHAAPGGVSRPQQPVHRHHRYNSSDEKYLLSQGKYLFRSALQRPGVPLRPHVHRLRLGNHLRGRRPRQDPPEGGENICKQQEKYLFSYKKYFRLTCPWCLTTTAVTPTARTTLPTP